MSEYAPKIEGWTDTATASAAITAGNVLIVSGTGTVSKSSAASKAVCGVAGNDASASGDKITRHHGGVQRLVNTGGVTAGDVLESAASGAVATHTEGTNDDRVIGVALTTATTGNVAEVLFLR